MQPVFGDAPPSPLPHDWEAAPCLDLINSRWSDHLGRNASYDRLPISKFRRTFLRRWRFSVADPDDSRAIAELAGLRTLLRTTLEQYASGRTLSGVLRQRLEAYLNRVPIQLQLRRDGPKLAVRSRKGRHDWDTVFFEIAMSAVRLMGDHQTVKACANPNCSWMFVDESRPHTRRWCNALVCGSLHNVRRFRSVRSGKKSSR